MFIDNWLHMAKSNILGLLMIDLSLLIRLSTIPMIPVLINFQFTCLLPFVLIHVIKRSNITVESILKDKSVTILFFQYKFHCMHKKAIYLDHVDILLDQTSWYHNWKYYTTFYTFLEFDLLRSFKAKCDGMAGLPIYGFLLVLNTSIWPPIQDMRVCNMSDLELDLPRSLKGKCDCGWTSMYNFLF